MATYETVLTVPRPIEVTFAFVSEFSNAVHWDPRTYDAEMVSDGPVGVGTRFLLTGGALRQDTLRRLHLSERLVGNALPYDVVEFDPPNGFVLEGESSLYVYDDHLDFTADGDATRLRYAASLDAKRPFGFADRVLQRMFQRIGDDATRDLPATVERLT